jgi:hypothetical protein
MNLLEALGIEGDNMKINLQEIVFDSLGWIHLTQDRGHYRALMQMLGEFV